MEQYDPYAGPSMDEWKSLDEAEQMILVEKYHRRAGEELPNHKVHAMVHTMVENQVALGDEIPIAAELERLMNEGLDRHEAIHAIGSALVEHIHEMQTGNPSEDPDERNRQYYSKVQAMTAEKWRESGEEED